MTPPMTRATNAQTTMATIFRRPPDFCAGGCDSPHSGQNLVLLDSAALQPGHVFGMAPPKVDAVMIPPGNVPAAGVTRRDNTGSPPNAPAGSLRLLWPVALSGRLALRRVALRRHRGHHRDPLLTVEE